MFLGYQEMLASLQKLITKSTVWSAKCSRTQIWISSSQGWPLLINPGYMGLSLLVTSTTRIATISQISITETAIATSLPLKNQILTCLTPNDRRWFKSNQIPLWTSQGSFNNSHSNSSSSKTSNRTSLWITTEAAKVGICNRLCINLKVKSKG